MATWQEHVLPHGPLVAIGPRLWILTGRLKRGSMTRNMVVHKLASGGLLIHSAIAVDEETLEQMTMQGKPEVMIVPNRFHRMDARVWKERFPNLIVLAPRAAVASVEKVIAVDATCEERLPPLGVNVLQPPGVKPFELCYEMETGNGKALVVTDMLMNLEHRRGLDGWILKALGSTGFFGMTFIGRVLLLKDRKAFKGWLTEQASRREPAAICVAHGDPIIKDCTAELLNAAARL